MIVIVMILAVFAALLHAEYLKAKADADADYEYAQIRRKLEMCKDAQSICSGDCEHCARRID